MQKRLIQISAALLAVAAVVGVIYLLGFFDLSQAEPPMFVVYDDKRPGEALAVYPDPTLLKKHHVSAETFEAAFRAELNAVGEAIGKVLAELFVDPSEQQNPKASSTTEQDEARFGITSEAYQEICEATRMEVWALHADGTHTVKEQLPQRTRAPQKHGDLLPQRKSADGSLPQDKGTWHISTPPTTLEAAKKTFTKNTGIAWPDNARDVHFDENRVPLLGDGLFYVVFTVPSKLLKAWLEFPPPWEGKTWSQGPIPAEVGCHCGFGFQSPNGWCAREGGPKEYSGGATEILEILKCKDVRYAARDRGPAGNPWYNGDLLILDARTGAIRYCSWDM